MIRRSLIPVQRLSRMHLAAVRRASGAAEGGQISTSPKATPQQEWEAAAREDRLDFTTATKMLLSEQARPKKFGIDFHIVQFILACLPSLAVYLVAMYARSEMKKLEKDKERLAIEQAKRNPSRTDVELSQIIARLETIEGVVQELQGDGLKPVEVPGKEAESAQTHGDRGSKELKEGPQNKESLAADVEQEKLVAGASQKPVTTDSQKDAAHESRVDRQPTFGSGREERSTSKEDPADANRISGQGSISRRQEETSSSQKDASDESRISEQRRDGKEEASSSQTGATGESRGGTEPRGRGEEASSSERRYEAEYGGQSTRKPGYFKWPWIGSRKAVTQTETLAAPGSENERKEPAAGSARST